MWYGRRNWSNVNRVHSSFSSIIIIIGARIYKNYFVSPRTGREILLLFFLNQYTTRYRRAEFEIVSNAKLNVRTTLQKRLFLFLFTGELLYRRAGRGFIAVGLKCTARITRKTRRRRAIEPAAVGNKTVLARAFPAYG